MDYERHDLRELELSTVVPCKKCGKYNYINEAVMYDDRTGEFYHKHCASGPTRVVTLELTDDLGVKSEGN